MSRSHKVAWAAGFIDGDGFITIQNRKSVVKGKEYRSVYLRVGCCQASQVPLKELKRLFGGTIREKNSGPNREGYNRKVQWLWTLSTKQAANALQELLPFLVHKKDVAVLGIELQGTMAKGKTSEDVLTYRQLLKDKVASINAES